MSTPFKLTTELSNRINEIQHFVAISGSMLPKEGPMWRLLKVANNRFDDEQYKSNKLAELTQAITIVTEEAEHLRLERVEFEKAIDKLCSEEEVVAFVEKMEARYLEKLKIKSEQLAQEYQERSRGVSE